MSRVSEFCRNKELLQMETRTEFSTACIYHYTSPEGLLGILRKNGQAALWFTQYDSLNDRSERENTVRFLHGYCDHLVRENKISDEFCREVKALTPSDWGYITYPDEVEKENDGVIETVKLTMFSGRECDTYLCCFSTNDDLLPMWNYYSKSMRYEGYSIGFWSYALETCFERGYSIQLRNVIYLDSEKTKMWDMIIPPLYEIYQTGTEEDKNEVLRRIQYYLNEWQLIFKEEAFSHEREVRAILKVPKERRKDGIKGYISERKYRNSNGYIVPYVELLCDKGCVHSVTSAPMLEKELAIRNIEDYLSEYGYDHIYCKASSVPIRF